MTLHVSWCVWLCVRLAHWWAMQNDWTSRDAVCVGELVVTRNSVLDGVHIDTIWQIRMNYCVCWRCSTHTHPFNGPFPGLPGWAGTRKVKPIWISLKQETVASAGPYASLHLAPDRQPHQQPITLFFYRSDAPPVAQPTASKHWRQIDTIWRIRMYYRGCRWCSLMSDFVDQLLS